jgi:hypothetical protein
MDKKKKKEDEEITEKKNWGNEMKTDMRWRGLYLR